MHVEQRLGRLCSCVQGQGSTTPGLTVPATRSFGRSVHPVRWPVDSASRENGVRLQHLINLCARRVEMLPRHRLVLQASHGLEPRPLVVYTLIMSCGRHKNANRKSRLLANSSPNKKRDPGDIPRHMVCCHATARLGVTVMAVVVCRQNVTAYAFCKRFCNCVTSCHVHGTQ